MPLKCFCTLTAALHICFSAVLLTNGDFERSFGTGWQIHALWAADSVSRCTWYDPDPDYEALVYTSNGGSPRLYQRVNIPVTALDFSAILKLSADDNNADTLCWAAAALVISYVNQSGNVLGQTRIGQWTTPCPWQNSPVLHLVSVADTLWNAYSFSIDNELAQLPGVDPAQVRSIEIALFDTTAHTC
ncbi:MAG TPA: hypothetical protein VF399_12495 [bacterium]